MVPYSIWSSSVPGRQRVAVATHQPQIAVVDVDQTCVENSAAYYLNPLIHYVDSAARNVHAASPDKPPFFERLSCPLPLPEKESGDESARYVRSPLVF